MDISRVSGSLVDKLMTADIATKGPVTVKTSDQNGTSGMDTMWITTNFGTALSPVTFTDVSVNGDLVKELVYDKYRGLLCSPMVR